MVPDMVIWLGLVGSICNRPATVPTIHTWFILVGRRDDYTTYLRLKTNSEQINLKSNSYFLLHPCECTYVCSELEMGKVLPGLFHQQDC